MLSGNLSRLFTSKEQYLLVGVASAIVVGCLTIVLTRDSAPDEDAVFDEAATAAVETVQPVVPAPPPQTPPPVEASVEPIDPAPARTSPESVAVAITGSVRKPGVYTLRYGARVQDLIDDAGGLLDEADVRDINMSAELMDNTTLTIPAGAYSSSEGGRLVVKGAPDQVVTNLPEYTISGWATRQLRSGSSDMSLPSDTPSGSQSGADGLVNINTAPQEVLETLPGIGAVKAQEIIKYRSQQPFGSIEDLDNVHGIGPKTLENLRPHVTVDPS